ncbi:unnamed protein product, partial [Symbiodinium microadriaticum]
VPYVKIGLCKHAMLGVVDFAEYLANSEEYAYKLLAGYATTESCKWKAEFASFWQKFATVEPHHDVFRRYNHCLGNCCPIFLHGDEGTSYGKKGLFQFSWSPVLSAGASGLHRYFMISQLSYKFYAKLAKGNAKGNPALDAIMAAGCQSCWTAYEVGVKCGQERIYLVTIGLTGDHVFHAKAMHLVRNHVSAAVCPHCEANITNIPYEDVSAEAAWIATIGRSDPWRVEPVFGILPGGAHASFIRLDTFHLGPLGAAHYAAPSILCLLLDAFDHFKPPRGGSQNVEHRLAYAHTFFESFCKSMKQPPRDLKDFTKDKLHWPSKNAYPMLSCKGGDSTLMMLWLQDYMESIPHDMSDPLLLVCLETLVAYNGFWNLCYFNLVPKIHYLAHVALNLHKALDAGTHILNPSVWATPMAEDY